MGCNDGSMVAPVDGPGGVGVEPGFYGNSSTPDNPALPRDNKQGHLISAEFGGTITNGRVALEFPAGALSEDTYITMQLVDETNLIVEFGPHGLVFNELVTFTWRLEGTDREGLAESTVIKWRNPYTELLEDIYNLPPEGSNTVKGLLEHFSNYEAIQG
jgi:hypothetical protein